MGTFMATTNGGPAPEVWTLRLIFIVGLLGSVLFWSNPQLLLGAPIPSAQTDSSTDVELQKLTLAVKAEEIQLKKVKIYTTLILLGTAFIAALILIILQSWLLTRGLTTDRIANLNTKLDKLSNEVNTVNLGGLQSQVGDATNKLLGFEATLSRHSTTLESLVRTLAGWSTDIEKISDLSAGVGKIDEGLQKCCGDLSAAIADLKKIIGDPPQPQDAASPTSLVGRIAAINDVLGRADQPAADTILARLKAIEERPARHE
jgi:archaellum component FlaC